MSNLPGSTGQQQSISLTSNISFTSDPILCPNSLGLVEFECIGVNVETLLWRSNGSELAVYSISTDDQSTTDIQIQPPGFEFFLESFTFDAEQRTANFTIVLIAELSAINPGTEIECLPNPSLSRSINVTYSLQSMLNLKPG